MVEDLKNRNLRWKESEITNTAKFQPLLPVEKEEKRDLNLFIGRHKGENFHGADIDIN